MRATRWGEFVSWLIVAGLAVGGFAAFSPNDQPPQSTTIPSAVVADGRGIGTGRILASAFATAAADRTFLTATSALPATDDRADELPQVTTPPPSSTQVQSVPAPDAVASSAVAWPSGSSCEASWYGPGFEGKSTANGESFDPSAYTAALHDVAFNTTVRVTRVDTGAVTIVRINDRGPYVYEGCWRRHPSRCIDLSEAAMAALGGIEDGVIAVTISY